MVEIYTCREVPLAKITLSPELRANEDLDMVEPIRRFGLRVPLAVLEWRLGYFQILPGGGNRRLRALRAMGCPGDALVLCRVRSLGSTPFGDDLVAARFAPLSIDLVEYRRTAT